MSWESRLKSAYGITPEEYADILKFQKGRCAVCKRWPEPRTHLAVDHDHLTGAIRGLLCARCNFSLFGIFGDKREFYQAAADYLTINPALYALLGVRFVPDSPGAEECQL